MDMQRGAVVLAAVKKKTLSAGISNDKYGAQNSYKTNTL
jgi:hypothetical protein